MNEDFAPTRIYIPGRKTHCPKPRNVMTVQKLVYSSSKKILPRDKKNMLAQGLLEYIRVACAACYT